MTTQALLRCVLPLTLVASMVTGCEFMKAKPAPDAGYIAEPEKMEKRERAPFHRSWVDPKYKDYSDFDSILVAPVNTDHVLEQSTWAKTNPRNIVIEDDLKDIAKEMKEIVETAFRESENNRFKIVDKPTDKTLILELAIVELVPGKAFLGTLGLAAIAMPPPVGIPVGAAASLADDGWMAIEGRAREGKTEEVVVQFADREKAKTRIVDFEAATWYGHARESMHDWAEQFVELANSPQDYVVEDSSPFTFLPW